MYEMKRGEVVEHMVASILQFRVQFESQTNMSMNPKYSLWAGSFSGQLRQAKFGTFAQVQRRESCFYQHALSVGKGKCSVLFCRVLLKQVLTCDCLWSGKLDDFKKGLDSHLGMPSFNVKLQMQREHCAWHDSYTMFSPPNNEGIYTCADTEWHYVVNYDPTKDWPGAKDRRGETLHYFLSHKNAKEAGLTETEVIGLRLYSGGKTLGSMHVCL